MQKYCRQSGELEQCCRHLSHCETDVRIPCRCMSNVIVAEIYQYWQIKHIRRNECDFLCENKAGKCDL